MANNTKVNNVLSTVFLSMKWHRKRFAFYKIIHTLAYTSTTNSKVTTQFIKPYIFLMFWKTNDRHHYFRVKSRNDIKVLRLSTVLPTFRYLEYLEYNFPFGERGELTS